MTLDIAIFLGTVRSDRVGPRVGRYLANTITARGHRPAIVDPLEYPLPLLDKMYKEYPPGQAPETMEKIAGIIKLADAFIIVTAEYNHTPPPALTNMLDHFLEEWFFRPSAIACYSPGAYGGVRAAMPLRAMLCELGMPSIPSLMPFPKVRQALDENGVASDPRTDKSAARFLSELEWYAGALKEARAKGLPY